MQDENPYAAPEAPVEDVAHFAGTGALIEGGRTVPSGNSWQWIVHGYDLFKQSPGVWILILVIAFVILALLSAVPLGPLASNLLLPVLIAGMMEGCHAQTQGEDLEVAHLFAGFRDRVGQLVLVGLLYMIGLIAARAVAGLMFGVGMFAAVMTGGTTAGVAPLTFLLFTLVVLALVIPLQMAIWFAPSLVVFHDLPAVDAMKQSFQAGLKNIVPFLVYGLIIIGLGLLATIPLFLGWLVLFPTLVGSVYYSYRDIFLEEA
jgi:uncharacterized membrane protein